MVFADHVPICIQSRSCIPARVTEANRPVLKVAEVLTYAIMVEEAITIPEMHLMGCNLQQVIFCWGEQLAAANLNFCNMTPKCLNAVKCLLQTKVMRRKFPSVNWFAVGLTLRDIVVLQPSVETLRISNVSVPDLQANNAHDYGENWQRMFDWSPRDWKDLGFDAKAYHVSLQLELSEKGTPPKKIKIRRSWGPCQVLA